MKTVDGILREMRELAKEVQGNSISNAYELLMGYAERIEAAVKPLKADRDNWRRQALDEDARANATRDKSSQVGNAPPMNINKINNYDEMVNAWNDYVRKYHGRFEGFLAWLFDKAKGEEQ